MAVSRKTQKDVDKYEAKLIGPFTTKQAVYIGIGAVIAYILWKIMTVAGVDSTIKTAIVIIVVAAVVLLGWVKVYGMTATQFLSGLYEYSLLSSKSRPYKILNDKDFGKPLPQKEHKKDKDYPDYE